MSKQHAEHVAVIMDGNGRWANEYGKMRITGHRRGVEVAREIVRASAEFGVTTLTLFALSTENRHRPRAEVSALTELFIESLRGEIDELIANGVRLQVIGELSCFGDTFIENIRKAEARTAGMDRLKLNIAINYSGRWDIANAVARLLHDRVPPAPADEETIARILSARLATGDVDLLIRTGGERRLSNFLLWQCAYAEMYFTDTLWPDFDKHQYAEALAWYEARERRFGLTSGQVWRGWAQTDKVRHKA